MCCYEHLETCSDDCADNPKTRKTRLKAPLASKRRIPRRHARLETEMAAPTPPESLVLYGDPIFTGETLDPTKKAAGSSTPVGTDGIGRIEDILNAMLPPQCVLRLVLHSIGAVSLTACLSTTTTATIAINP